MNARMLRRAGVLALVLGLLAAALAYWHASVSDPRLTHGYEIVGGQVFDSEQADEARQRQIEHVGGKAAVWAVEFNEWFGSLWQGTRLAATLAILGALTMLAFFYIAGLMDEGHDS